MNTPALTGLMNRPVHLPAMLKLVVVLSFTLLCSPSVFAHGSHSSITEIEWNSKSERFEVAMRVSIADLEDAVSLTLKTRFHLENNPQRDQHLQAYLQKNFAAVFRGHTECRLYWVGCELELHDVWIYFEAQSIDDKATDGDENTTVTAETNHVQRWQDLFAAGGSFSKDTNEASTVVINNTVLLAVQPEQVNIVTLTRGHSTESGTMSRELTKLEL